ncbi:MAG: pyridoxal phosphate-dependent aminotransferase, partial [Flavobacteriaceae bacterium]
MPQLSNKGTNLPTSPIRKLVSYSDQAKSNGIEVLHLNIGQPDIPSPSNAMEAVKSVDLSLLPYGPSQGTLSYRQKLATYYKKHQIDISPDD